MAREAKISERQASSRTAADLPDSRTDLSARPTTASSLMSNGLWK
jgi:hypothetical protein